MKPFYLKNVLPPVSLLFFLFSTVMSSAQIQYGLKGGLTISTVKKEMEHSSYFSYDTRPKEGALLGAWFFVPQVYKKVGLQMELLYANRGSEYMTTLNNDAGNGGYSPYGYGYGYGNYVTGRPVLANESLHVLNLPISMVFRSDKVFRYYAGAELSYLLMVGDEPPYGNADYKRYLINVIAGLQYNISEKVSTDLRYNYGINSYKIGYTSDETKFRPRGVELSVSYAFGSIGKK